MIWECTHEDVDWMVKKVDEFNTMLGLEVNPVKVADVCNLVLKDGVALRSDTGLIAGLYMPDPFRDRFYLTELCWYDPGSTGMGLLRQFQRAGVVMGAQEVRMTTLEAHPRSGKILALMGYTPLEHGWGLTL